MIQLADPEARRTAREYRIYYLYYIILYYIIYNIFYILWHRARVRDRSLRAPRSESVAALSREREPNPRPLGLVHLKKNSACTDTRNSIGCICIYIKNSKEQRAVPHIYI